MALRAVRDRDGGLTLPDPPGPVHLPTPVMEGRERPLFLDQFETK